MRKNKMLLQGGGYFQLPTSPPTTLFYPPYNIIFEIMQAGGRGVKKNVVGRGRGSFWGVLPTPPTIKTGTALMGSTSVSHHDMLLVKFCQKGRQSNIKRKVNVVDFTNLQMRNQKQMPFVRKRQCPYRAFFRDMVVPLLITLYQS